MTATPDSPPTPGDDEQVAEYLRQHPDFFHQHEDLLDELLIPHARGNTISLVERQLQRLRERNGHLQGKLFELAEIARNNERLSERMHHLALSLVEARNPHELVANLRESLRSDFDVPLMALRLRNAPAPVQESLGEYCLGEDNIADALQPLLQKTVPNCSPLRRAQLDLLFGEHAEEVRATALIPLRHGSDLGFLVLARHALEGFHPDMGTHFLNQLSELFSACLVRHWGD